MTIQSLRRLTGAAVLLGAVLLASCESPTGGTGDPAQMDVVSGGNQQGVVGEELPQPLVVRVVDAQGNPVPGQIVNFRVVSGGGTVFAGAAITTADGIARERWILGTVAADSQRVEARAVDPQSGEALVFAVFRATAVPGPAAAITPVSGSGLTGTPGMPLADSLGARVADRFGNPVRGATVAWSVIRGGGSVSPPTSTTDTAGIARTQWVLGSWSDSTQTVQAAAGVGLTTMFVASTGIPAGAALTVVSGSGQTGVAGTALPQPLVVKLTLADGRPVPGAPVTWAVSGGTVTPSVSTTDAQGTASAQWVLPTGPGTATATATTPGVMPAGFTATVLPGPAARLVITGGDNQVCYPNTRCPEPLSVHALDAAGNGVWEPTVTWEAIGEGNVTDVYDDRRSGRTLTTTTGPHHRVRFSPYGAPGTRQVRASSGSAQAIFNITVAPTRLVLHSPSPTLLYGDSLWVAVDAYATTPITSVTARVADRQITLAHPSGERYNGVLRLDGLPRGRYEVVITVNAEGSPADSIRAPFTLDRKPVVTVLSPADSTVSRGSVRIHATCQDDDPGGCKSLTVAGITGTSVIDQSYTFNHDGWYQLVFTGTDSAGHKTVETREGWVERTAPWTLVAEVPAVGILDADDSRVLYVDTWGDRGGTAKVLNWMTGATSVVVPDQAIQKGRLTPAGALVARLVGDNVHLFDWRGGTAVDRGSLSSGSPIAVEGSWAAWISVGVMRQDVATGVTQQVGPRALELDVADNGDVVWAASPDRLLSRYRNGTVTVLSPPDHAGAHRPRTDGINTAYGGYYPSVGPALELIGPQGRDTLVAPPHAVHVTADSLEYELRDGWTAFRKWGADGVPRLWMRAPDGTLQQASSLRTTSIRAMGPRGQVIFVSGNRMYYTAPPFTRTVDVGTADYYVEESWRNLGVRVVWPGETPYALIGRYVFRIDL